MKTPSFRKGTVPSRRRVRSARVAPHARRLRVELLEDRRLLSVGSPQVELFNASPALFAENQGQWADPSIRFIHNGDGANVAMTDAGPVFQIFRRELNEGAAAESKDDPWPGDYFVPDEYATEALTFSASFAGANAVLPVGLQRSPTQFNYFIGPKENWHSGVPTYQAVAYEGLYPGIDLVTWGRRDSLKYEFHVAPGADYRQIRVRYEGINGLSVDSQGVLHVETALGELTDDAPFIYQEINGQLSAVAGQFQLLDANTYAFTITGDFDPQVEMVIDPNLAWSTYLGGSGRDEAGGIAVDSGGNALVTGTTYSADLSGANNSLHGACDAFVAKLSGSGTLVWMTYLGGSDGDMGNGIAVDPNNDALVTGHTGSTDLPGANNSYHGGGYYGGDAFVAKVSGSGALAWATYLGGSVGDVATGIALDTDNSALVVGTTASGDFEGANNDHHGGWDDVIVAKVSSDGGLVWATYLGGSNLDRGTGVAVDSAHNALVTGYTDSTDFEGANNGKHGSVVGTIDALVAKVTASGSLEWATYLGGDGNESGRGIGVDSADNALVTGGDAIEVAAFVAKVSGSGTLDWTTYLPLARAGNGIAVDGDSAIVAGATGSAQLPGSFVVKVTGTGVVVWTTYLGPNPRNNDLAHGVALDSDGNALATGNTGSTNFPAANNTYHGGFSDVFVAKFTGLDDTTPASASLNAPSITTGGATTYTFTVTYSDPDDPVRVATIDDDDLVVTGPHGYSQAATLVTVDDDTDGTPRIATYEIPAPSGTWDRADNGQYAVVMQLNQVSDSNGNFVPAGELGKFVVAIGPTGGPIIVDGPWTARPAGAGAGVGLDPDWNALTLESDPANLQFLLVPDSDKAAFPNSVWNMQADAGRLYLGYGDFWSNRGPVDIVSYDATSGELVREMNDIPEEQIGSWHVSEDGTLYVGGWDAQESWTFGNFYVRNREEWQKLRTIPKGVLVNQVVDFGGYLYAAYGSDNSPPVSYPFVLASADSGASWSYVPLEQELARYSSVSQLAAVPHASGESLYALVTVQDFDSPYPVARVYHLGEGGWERLDLPDPRGEFRPRGLYAFQDQLLVTGMVYDASLDQMRIVVYALNGQTQQEWEFLTDRLADFNLLAQQGPWLYAALTEPNAWQGPAPSYTLYRTQDGQSWEELAPIALLPGARLRSLGVSHGRLYVGASNAGWWDEVPNVIELWPTPVYPIQDGTLSWDAEVPAGAQLSLKIRSAAGWVGPDGTPDTSFTVSGQALAALHNGDTTFQVQIYKTRNANGESPLLKHLTLDTGNGLVTLAVDEGGGLYAAANVPSPGGAEYVSAAFGLLEPVAGGQLFFDSATPDGTSLGFQVRSALTELQLQQEPFLGPDGTSGSFYDRSGQPLWTGHDGDGFLQYRVVFGSSDARLAPLLHQVTLVTQTGRLDHFDIELDTSAPWTAGEFYPVTVTARAADGTSILLDGTVLVSAVEAGSGVLALEPTELLLVDGSGTLDVSLRRAATTEILVSLAGVTSRSAAVSVRHGPAASIAVTSDDEHLVPPRPNWAPVVGVGTAFGLDVTILDRCGNIVTDYTGTVQSDRWRETAQGQLFPPYEFQPSDGGRHHFSNAVLQDLGEWNLVISDVADARTAGSFTVVAADATRPTADLVDPAAGSEIAAGTLNSRQYLDVTFADAGSGLNLGSINDPDQEFILEGAAASGVTVDGVPTQIGDTFRYHFTGDFGAGPVRVHFLEGAVADQAGNTIADATQTFAVQPVWIIDDGDPAFSAVGPWTLHGGQGFQDDWRDSARGTGKDTAIWVFAVNPGRYRVAATWPADANDGATNAPFTVYDGTKRLGTVAVNQKRAPSDFNDQGVSWKKLSYNNNGGVFRIAGRTLKVKLADNANGNVTADAIRIERMPDVQVFDGARELPEGAALSFGTTWPGVAVTKTVKVKNRGTSTITLTPLDPGAMPEGFELVSNFGKTVLAANAWTTFTVRLNSASSGDYHGPISLASDDPAGPFDLALDGQISASRIIDDGDAAFTKLGVWKVRDGQGFQGDVRDNTKGTGADRATWTFTVPEGQYRVAITWAANPAAGATNTPFSVYDGARLLGTVAVNQKLAPGDFNDQGVSWASLSLPANAGIFQITGDKLVVKLTDKADGTVIADAVRIERVDAAVTASGSGPTTAAKQTGAPADTPIDTRAHLAWATLYELQPKPRDPEELFSTLAISRRGRFGPWPRDEDDRHVIDSVFAALK